MGLGCLHIRRKDFSFLSTCILWCQSTRSILHVAKHLALFNSVMIVILGRQIALFCQRAEAANQDVEVWSSLPGSIASARVCITYGDYNCCSLCTGLETKSSGLGDLRAEGFYWGKWDLRHQLSSTYVGYKHGNAGTLGAVCLFFCLHRNYTCVEDTLILPRNLVGSSTLSFCCLLHF